MAVDYGSDLAGIDDLDAELSFVEGPRCLAENLVCRLGNVPGTTEDDPTNGDDLTLLVGDVIDVATEERKIVEQMKADERVARATSSLTQIGGNLTAAIAVFPSDGPPFDMVVSVDKAALKLEELNLKEAQ